VRIDALALRLRPRSPLEAADLGARLCQRHARSVYSCYALVLAPVAALCMATAGIASWLPGVALWCAKPWLDRTILFVLSRAAFGQDTGPRELWRAQRQVWWQQLALTFTVRRLSPWRSYTQPAYQLEGLDAWQARRRVLQLRRGRSGQAFLMTTAYGVAETSLAFALLSLAFWFAPTEHKPDLMQMFAAESSPLETLAFPLGYACVLLFLEPFFVASGFAMYLNRRAELEAWDIEQEFRRAFAH
jgi:hypothetical protein